MKNIIDAERFCDSAQQLRENDGDSSRGGWSEKEEKMLFGLAQEALDRGLPVKSAFDRLAEETGRRPNSIRNFYYLRRRESGMATSGSFVPFEQDEVEMLIKKMLLGQAEGKSVRSIAMEMGGGDKKVMLRYQNKYRSVVRTSPDMVKHIMAKLKEDGEEVADPYAGKAFDRGVRKCSELSIDEDVRVCVNAITALSGKARAADRYAKELDTAREMMEINRRFLELNGIERYSSLGDYVVELQNAMINIQ